MCPGLSFSPLASKLEIRFFGWCIISDGKTIVIIYLAAINLVTFAQFWRDKRRARLGGQRIAEKTLLILALAGGSLGALAAQQTLRHKTRKQPFRAWLAVIALVHIFAGLLLAFF